MAKLALGTSALTPDERDFITETARTIVAEAQAAQAQATPPCWHSLATAADGETVQIQQAKTIRVQILQLLQQEAHEAETDDRESNDVYDLTQLLMLLESFISSEEFELWLEQYDAGERSAAAVTAPATAAQTYKCPACGAGVRLRRTTKLKVASSATAAEENAMELTEAQISALAAQLVPALVPALAAALAAQTAEAKRPTDAEVSPSNAAMNDGDADDKAKAAVPTDEEVSPSLDGRQDESPLVETVTQLAILASETPVSDAAAAKPNPFAKNDGDDDDKAKAAGTEDSASAADKPKTMADPTPPAVSATADATPAEAAKTPPQGEEQPPVTKNQDGTTVAYKHDDDHAAEKSQNDAKNPARAAQTPMEAARAAHAQLSGHSPDLHSFRPGVQADAERWLAEVAAASQRQPYAGLGRLEQVQPSPPQGERVAIGAQDQLAEAPDFDAAFASLFSRRSK